MCGVVLSINDTQGWHFFFIQLNTNLVYTVGTIGHDTIYILDVRVDFRERKGVQNVVLKKFNGRLIGYKDVCNEFSFVMKFILVLGRHIKYHSET